MFSLVTAPVAVGYKDVLTKSESPRQYVSFPSQLNNDDDSCLLNLRYSRDSAKHFIVYIPKKKVLLLYI